MFIHKAPAATIQTLAKALLELYGSNSKVKNMKNISRLIFNQFQIFSIFYFLRGVNFFPDEYGIILKPRKFFKSEKEHFFEK